MVEKLIIAVVGFPVIYDVSLFAYRDINKKMIEVVKLFPIQPELSLEPAVIQPQLLHQPVIFPKLLTGLENVMHPHRSPTSSPQIEQCHTKRNNLIIHRDVNLIRRRATLFIRDIFALECLFFSGNSIHLLKTIPRLVNVYYNVEIRLALNHEHKSTPPKWHLIGLFS